LLGLSSLGEGREASEIAEGHGDLAAMAFEHLRALLARDQGGDLRRQEPRQLAALTFQHLKQLDVRDRDGSLIGEGLQELDLLWRERLNFRAADRDASNPDAMSNEGHRESCPVPPASL